jgi:hypothetical protein
MPGIRPALKTVLNVDPVTQALLLPLSEYRQKYRLLSPDVSNPMIQGKPLATGLPNSWRNDQTVRPPLKFNDGSPEDTRPAATAVVAVP